MAESTPGDLRFILIDPVGLGQNVTPFTPFADLGIGEGRAWTELRQIEQRLHDLVDLVEGSMVDGDQPPPYGVNMAELEHGATVLAWDGRRFVWQDPDFRSAWVGLDRSPRAPWRSRSCGRCSRTPQRRSSRAPPDAPSATAGLGRNCVS